MKGERRRAETVVSRPVVRTLALAVALVAVGNSVAIGCMWAWANAIDLSQASLALIGTAAGLTMLGGVAAMVAWGFAR